MIKYTLPMIAALALIAVPVKADKLKEIYKGERSTVTIPYGPGGTYDKYGSSFSNHLGRHIPENQI